MISYQAWKKDDSNRSQITTTHSTFPIANLISRYKNSLSFQNQPATCSAPSEDHLRQQPPHVDLFPHHVGFYCVMYRSLTMSLTSLTQHPSTQSPLILVEKTTNGKSLTATIYISLNIPSQGQNSSAIALHASILTQATSSILSLKIYQSSFLTPTTIFHAQHRSSLCSNTTANPSFAGILLPHT